MSEDSRIVVERTLCVVDPEECNRLWRLYDEAFSPINEETPIIQSFPEEQFRMFLASERVVKLLARLGDEVVGIILVTSDLSLEPMLSLPYFEKHYAGQTIHYVLGVAVDSSLAGRSVGTLLSRAVCKEVRRGDCLLFLFSSNINSAIPRFVVRTTGSATSSVTLDAEVAQLSWWCE